MIILDSCVWIAFLNKEDSLHEKAENLVVNLDFNKVLLPNLILYEILTVLKLKSNQELQLLKAFLRLLKGVEIEVSNIPDQIIEFAIKTLVEVSHKTSFVDVCLYEWSKKNNTQIITFDDNLNKWIKNS